MGQTGGELIPVPLSTGTNLNNFPKKHKPMKIFVVFFILASTAVVNAQPPADNLYNREHNLWKPVPDDIYLQERGQKIPLQKPVTSIALLENRCYVVMERKIHLLSGEAFNLVKSGPENVKQLKSVNGALWALSSNGIYNLMENKWQKIDDKEFVDVCMHLGVLHAATSE